MIPFHPRDRIKELRRVKASELLPNPKNWRVHPIAQQEALRGVLAEVGYADALLARETEDGLMLVDGHLRAETTPDAEVPVLVLDINEEEADLILATLDPLAAMAEAEQSSLSALLDTVMDSPVTKNASVLELLQYIANGTPPGFEPLGMWEPDIADVSGVTATNTPIESIITVRCPINLQGVVTDRIRAVLEEDYPEARVGG